MSLSDLIRGKFANAKVANPANDGQGAGATLAKIATLALANPVGLKAEPDSLVPWPEIRDRIAEGWRAEFSPPGPDGRQAIRWTPPGTWEPAEPETEAERCPHHVHPITEAELAHLVTTAAKDHGVAPVVVWAWLALDDIEALRSGDLEEARAFRAAVASAVAGGRLAPDGGHSLPFPTDDLRTHPERFEIVTFDRWRLASGSEVSFQLAIPREKYDGFELIKLLDEREAP